MKRLPYRCTRSPLPGVPAGRRPEGPGEGQGEGGKRVIRAILLIPIVVLCLGCGSGGGFFSLPDPGGNGDGIQQPQGIASVSGTIRDAVTSEPLANATVVFGGNKKLTEPDGTFSFQNVSVVRRSRRASARFQDGQNLVSLSVSLEQYDSVVRELPIGTGTIEPQEILLVPHGGSASVTGLVRDAATRNAILDASVIVGTGGQAREARTDTEGRFLVTGVEPGRQQLVVNAVSFVSHQQILENLSPGLTFELIEPIELLPAGTTVTVTGTVRDENGGPISGATVRIGEVTATTEPNGFYQLSGVPVGPQTFMVSASGFLPSTFSITITATTGAINIVLFRSGVNPPTAPFTVRGTVTVQGASDSGGVKVSALEQPGNMERDSVVTSADGRYTLFVPEGNYIIRAEKQGFRTAERNVTVPPGGQIVDNVNLILTPGP